MDGYLQGREETYFQNAVWALRKAAFRGHADAPGLLGIILANGYTTISRAKAAPDVEEAVKLFQRSDARGGTMGMVGTAGNRQALQLICVSLEDDIANATRKGNRTDLIYLRSMAQQLRCN